MKKPVRSALLDAALIFAGGVIFAVGFDLFLLPNGINTGGLTGLAMVIVTLTGFGSVGVLTFCCNVPLFLAGWRKLGRKFFFGSLLGMVASSVTIDVLARLLPPVEAEPLLAGLYGGALVGLGLGLAFARGASTGGADILARLLQRHLRSVSMGRVLLAVDLVVIVLTGVVFRDLDRVLYSAVALYVSSLVLDNVVYGLDRSRVVLIVSDAYELIVEAIERRLDRGATLLNGEGAYTGQEKKVILVAIRPRQLPELKEVVSEIDKRAFVIVQDAHQVQGEGFSRYSAEGM